MKTIASLIFLGNIKKFKFYIFIDIRVLINCTTKRTFTKFRIITNKIILFLFFLRSKDNLDHLSMSRALHGRF